MKRILCIYLPNRPIQRRALAQLAAWCEQFSPTVGLEDADEPAGLLLDVTGLGPLFGGEDALARRVVEAFHRRGYTVRVAVADTVGAAWAVAHYGEFSCSAPCEPPIPNHKSSIINHHFRIIPPSESAAALAPLPVQALRLSDETVRLLNGLGVYRIGRLSWLPRSGIASRLGTELVRRLDQAEGAVDEVIDAYHPPPQLEASRLLEHPTSRRKTIEQLVGQLLERLAGRLADRRCGAVQLECRLDCLASRPVCIRVGLFCPTADPRRLIELARMQLERLVLPSPVTGASVRAVAAAPFENRQGRLFAGSAGCKRRPLALLIDRLSSRLGRESTVGVQFRADAQPERVCRYVPLTGARSRRLRNRSRRAAGLVPGPAERPLRFRAPPEPLDVMSVVPDGPPVWFRRQGRRHRVVRHWGPERIETGWWRGRSVRRDYYRVETAGGARFWLFRRLSDGRWFLQGAFE